MSSPGTISAWLNDLTQKKDPQAIQHLWEVYFEKLVQVARGRLRQLPRAASADEEDVALSVFASFAQAVDAGRFPRLGDRDDLWQVLIVLTVRKAASLIEYEGRDKRNLWITRCLGDMKPNDSGDSAGSVFSGLLVAGDPPPELAA